MSLKLAFGTLKPSTGYAKPFSPVKPFPGKSRELKASEVVSTNFPTAKSSRSSSFFCTCLLNNTETTQTKAHIEAKTTKMAALPIPTNIITLSSVSANIDPLATGMPVVALFVVLLNDALLVVESVTVLGTDTLLAPDVTNDAVTEAILVIEAVDEKAVDSGLQMTSKLLHASPKYS